MSGHQWPLVTLEKVCERLIDYRGKTPPKTTSGIRLITAKVIKRGQILAEPAEYIATDFYDEWMTRGFPQDLDVLITTEAPLGEVAILRGSERIALAQRIILLRANTKIMHPVYLFFALQSDLTRGELHSRASGTTVAGIKQSELRQVQVAVPPLPIQHRIASILSAYDDLIENCERRIRVLDEMARALYREWFVLFRYPGHENTPLVDSPMGRIPKGWAPETIATLTSFLSRGISPQYVDDGPSTVINQRCIRDFRLSLSEARRQSKPIPDERRVRVGDVLINSTGVGTLGRVAQVLEEVPNCTVDTHVTIARPRPNTDSTFFGLTLLELQPVFERKGVGATGQTELSRAAIGEIAIAGPPREQQARFAECVLPMREETQNLQKRVQNLRNTRDLLLPRLLSGQLPVEVVP